MIRRELIFFVMNGLISVAIAFGVYRALVASGMLIEVANSIAYLAGMAYGFFANRRLTFRDRSALSAGKVLRYTHLHTFTLLVNMGANLTILGMISGLLGALSAAFLGAIAISTVLNFLGLKYWVFRHGAVNSTKAMLL